MRERERRLWALFLCITGVCAALGAALITTPARAIEGSGWQHGRPCRGRSPQPPARLRGPPRLTGQGHRPQRLPRWRRGPTKRSANARPPPSSFLPPTAPTAPYGRLRSPHGLFRPRGHTPSIAGRITAHLASPLSHATPKIRFSSPRFERRLSGVRVTAGVPWPHGYAADPDLLSVFGAAPATPAGQTRPAPALLLGPLPQGGIPRPPADRTRA